MTYFVLGGTKNLNSVNVYSNCITGCDLPIMADAVKRIYSVSAVFCLGYGREMFVVFSVIIVINS